MPPESFVMLLLVLGIAILPFVLLGLMIAVLNRSRDLSYRLDRIEHEVDRTQDLVRQLAAAKPAVSPPDEQAEAPPSSTPLPEPRETFVTPELVPAPPAPPPSPPLWPEPVLPAPVLPWAVSSGPELAPLVAPCEVSALPREPSRFETAAKEILRNIWKWIVVGEDQVPEGGSMESAIASNWLLRIAVLFLVMAAGFFLTYSIRRGWINEVGQVLLCAAAGLALLAVGTHMLGRKYHLIGQGLIGAGVATLYLSVFAARSFYDPCLIENPTAFALMIAVTCLAGWIAVRFHSMLVAVLGVLGGYGTPVMLRTGVVDFVGLYSYLLILGVGVFGVSIKKNWHLLIYLSFLGTYTLFFETMSSWEYDEGHFWQVMPFLVAFFVLYSTMTFLFNLVNRRKSTLLEVLGLLMNAGVFFATSYEMVTDAYPGKWVAVVSLGLAAFYAAHVYYFLIRRLLDRELLLSFTAFSAFFLAVTIPLLLSSDWVTASWAIQALVMLWIAGKLESEFLRQVAYLLYAVVLVRFGFVDLRHQYFGAMTMDEPVADYLGQMFQRLTMLGIPTASLAGAGWLLRMAPPRASLPVGRDNDVEPWIGQRWAIGAIMTVVAGMLFLALHLECNRSLLFFYPPLRLPLLSMLWVAMCVFLLYEYRLRPSDGLLTLLMLFVAGLVVKLFYFDLVAWHMAATMCYAGDYSFRDAAMRLLDFGAIIAFLCGGYGLLAGHTHARSAGDVFGSAAVGLLFVFSTLEVNTFLSHFANGSQAGGVSILWSLFALALIIAGIRRDRRAVRYVGLALFVLVASKVLLSDLVELDKLYRIIAFLVLGALLLSGSFVYLMYRPALSAVENRENAE